MIAGQPTWVQPNLEDLVSTKVTTTLNTKTCTVPRIRCCLCSGSAVVAAAAAAAAAAVRCCRCSVPTGRFQTRPGVQLAQLGLRP